MQPRHNPEPLRKSTCQTALPCVFPVTPATNRPLAVGVCQDRAQQCACSESKRGPWTNSMQRVSVCVPDSDSVLPPCSLLDLLQTLVCAASTRHSHTKTVASVHYSLVPQIVTMRRFSHGICDAPLSCGPLRERRCCRLK